MSRTLATRRVFALLGATLAVVGATQLDLASWRLYVTAFALLLPSYFFSIDVPPPAAIVLPYLSTVTALVYVGGLPIIAVDYLTKLASPRLKTALYRRGLYQPPPMLRPLIEAAAEGRRAPRDVWIDHWANHATGATGLAVRWTAFHLLTTRFPALRPIFAVMLSEVVGQTFWVVLHLFLPVPTASWFAKSRRPWSNFGLDEHTDVAFAMFLFFPFWLLLIYFGYAAYGLPGLVLGAVSSLAPHYVLKLLNDRREASERLKDTNRALELKALALEEKQEELKSFIYTVTHDLKNPLNAIQITADLLRESDGKACSAEGRDHLERIIRIASTSEDMIRDLMELFRVTSSPEPVDWVDLGQVAHQVVDTLAPQIHAKGVCVQVGPLPRLLGQEEKLACVLTNLLSNAVKYVPAGAGEVEVSAKQLNGSVRLCVRDNGIGIPAPYHRNIFELFGRVPSKEQAVDGHVVAGTGVGLAIVKRIVEAHLGEVWVESTPGAGSRFYVQLPAEPA